MVQPLTFIHDLPSHQVKSNTRLLPKAETPVPTLDSSCEPKIYKVLVCNMGKAKGTKSPTPGPTHRIGRRSPALEGQGTSLVPRGREEGPSSHHLGLGKLMQSWAERNQNRNWQHGVLQGWSGGRVNVSL